MAVQITRRPFTVKEYERMASAGILGEDDRVELIEGEIIKMSPIGSRHAACVDRLSKLLERRIGQDTIIRVQSPIRLNDYTEPQLDIAVLRLRADYYAEAHPAPDNVLLVVEVADTSLEYDRDVKLPRYAQAMIGEAWLVDLAHTTLTQYTQPSNGFYASVHQVERGGALVSTVFPDLLLSAEDMCG